MSLEGSRSITCRLAGRKALVTGGSGFIGSHLCRRLSDEGVETHVASRRKPSRSISCARWWSGDLAEYETVRRIVENVNADLIFHLASYVGGGRGLEWVLPTFWSNLASTVNLLTAIGHKGCQRVVLAGSMEEPEPSLEYQSPSSPYAAAKSSSSAYARMFHNLHKVPVVILRIFMVYGPRQRDLQKLIPSVIVSLLRGDRPKLASGIRLVDWIYIDDVVEGLIAAAMAPKVEGETIDVGSGHLVAIRTLVEQLVQIVNPAVEPAFGAVRDRRLERSPVANVDLARSLLQWSPQISLDVGLRRTVDWYARQMQQHKL